MCNFLEYKGEPVLKFNLDAGPQRLTTAPIPPQTRSWSTAATPHSSSSLESDSRTTSSSLSRSFTGSLGYALRRESGGCARAVAWTPS